MCSGEQFRRSCLQVSCTTSRWRPGWRRWRRRWRQWWRNGGGTWSCDRVQQLDGHRWRAGSGGGGSEEVERLTGTRLRDWTFDELNDVWRRRWARLRVRVSVLWWRARLMVRVSVVWWARLRFGVRVLWWARLSVESELTCTQQRPVEKLLNI